MGNVAVVGAQWGDEGKGKIVDWLSERADVVVRFQGGPNAGHTLVVGNIEYKLSLLPSGVVRPDKLSIIGNGVVVDPWALLAEIETMREKGLDISPRNLRLADNAALILPSHGALERAREERRGDKKLGTTGRGIGPAYEDKVGRRAVRVCDLADRQALEDRVDEVLLHHNALLRGLDAPLVERAELLDALHEVAPRILPYADRCWRLLDDARRRGRRVLFEGAQAAMLDVDATFVSLQRDPRPDDQAALRERRDIADLAAHLTDFAETSALASCLDLVITVDTSVAHLAGALGRRTWILLPYTPDFRWLLDRDDSPWYPTVRLFRQTETREYESVIEQMRNELSALAENWKASTAPH